MSVPSAHSYKGEVELGLVDGLVGGEVDAAKVGFDLFHHLPFGITKGRRNVGMYAKRRVSNVIDLTGEPTCFGKDLVANGLW